MKAELVLQATPRMNFMQMLSEQSRIQKKKNTPCDSIYMTTLIYFDRRQMLITCGGNDGEGLTRGLGSAGNVLTLIRVCSQHENLSGRILEIVHFSEYMIT